jgi:hypothetical protein
MKQMLRFLFCISFLCFAASSQLNAQCSPAGDPTVFGQNVWNVYAWNAGDGTLANNNSWSSNYAGYYVETELSFDTHNRWAELASPSSASGYQGCSVAVDDHSWSAKRKGFPCGHYQINIPENDDAGQLFIDGVKVWERATWAFSYSNIWEGDLGQNSEIEFRCTDGTGILMALLISSTTKNQLLLPAVTLPCVPGSRWFSQRAPVTTIYGQPGRRHSQ